MPPLNIRYSIPLHSARASRPRSPEALSYPKAIAANEALAALLDRIDLSLARRLRSCLPRYRCRLWRYCAFCGPIRENHHVRKYRARLDRLPAPTHLTLTTRSCYCLTREALTALADVFAQFRRERRFGHAVHGGVVNFQIDHGEHGWLPHLHALLDYRGGLSQTWLKETWTGLGGGWEVQNKTITPGTQGRVLAYGARRPDLPHDPILLRQFYSATQDFRFIQPWGTLHPLHGRSPQRRGHGGLVGGGGSR